MRTSPEQQSVFKEGSNVDPALPSDAQGNDIEAVLHVPPTEAAQTTAAITERHTATPSESLFDAYEWRSMEIKLKSIGIGYGCALCLLGQFGLLAMSEFTTINAIALFVNTATALGSIIIGEALEKSRHPDYIRDYFMNANRRRLIIASTLMPTIYIQATLLAIWYWTQQHINTALITASTACLSLCVWVGIVLFGFRYFDVRSRTSIFQHKSQLNKDTNLDHLAGFILSTSFLLVFGIQNQNNSLTYLPVAVIAFLLLLYALIYRQPVFRHPFEPLEQKTSVLLRTQFFTATLTFTFFWLRLMFPGSTPNYPNPVLNSAQRDTLTYSGAATAGIFGLSVALPAAIKRLGYKTNHTSSETRADVVNRTDQFVPVL